ncbi:MAG: M23 family metallopeptidase [Alphaproteobacteria bacterium]|nr:M23 family metallopeptidase [Alphaproteobacteria bacterium]
MRAALAALLILAPAVASAGPISLQFPLDCDLGESCFVQNYMDRDPGAGAQDYTGGGLTYDGHKGTDIRVPYRRQIEGAGVTVFASASGTVLGTRNTMADIAQGDTDAPDVSARECGNGVLIDLGDGWRTQYCHMRKGSITVKTGDLVTQGQTLGLIGLSGMTEFPHVHIQITKDDKLVDPFGPERLWAKPRPYQPGGFLGAGFSDTALNYSRIKQGPRQLDRLPTDAAAIVVWGLFYGLRKGDRIKISITNPDGTHLLQQSFEISRNRASAYRLAGKRLSKTQWPAGSYGAEIKLIRDGKPLSTRALTIQIFD